MAASLYTKCWTQTAIDGYFTAEAMSKTPAAFNQVHVPIDRIRVDPQYPAGQGRQEISECELRDIVRAFPPKSIESHLPGGWRYGQWQIRTLPMAQL